MLFRSSIREQDEFIKLGQALKKADLVSSGVEAKIVIQDGQVTVNGETELQIFHPFLIILYLTVT